MPAPNCPRLLISINPPHQSGDRRRVTNSSCSAWGSQNRQPGSKGRRPQQHGGLPASGCPLDLHRRAFAPTTCAQSVFGPVGALVSRDTSGDFSLLVVRSLARDVWSMLCTCGAQYGYEVLAPAPFR